MSVNTRLVLRYEQGSFSMTRLNPALNPGHLWQLAQGINSLQTDTAQQVEVVERFLLI